MNAKEVRVYPKDEGKKLGAELGESEYWIEIGSAQQYDAIYTLYLNEAESAMYVIRIPASDNDGTTKVLARYEETSQPWFSRGMEILALTMRIQERYEEGTSGLPFGISFFENASDDQLEIPDWWTIRLHNPDGTERWKSDFKSYEEAYQFIRSTINS